MGPVLIEYRAFFYRNEWKIEKEKAGCCRKGYDGEVCKSSSYKNKFALQ